MGEDLAEIIFCAFYGVYLMGVVWAVRDAYVRGYSAGRWAVAMLFCPPWALGCYLLVRWWEKY